MVLGTIFLRHSYFLGTNNKFSEKNGTLNQQFRKTDWRFADRLWRRTSWIISFFKSSEVEIVLIVVFVWSPLNSELTLLLRTGGREFTSPVS